MNMIDFLAKSGCPSDIGPIVHLAHNIYNILMFAIPILLILFGLIDLGKAVIAGKEDEMKKAQGTLIKRVIYAVLVFFIFTIVSFVMGIVTSSDGEESTYDWKACWSQYD